MKKIALATAAILVAAGGAFAQTASNPSASDRPAIWQAEPAAGIDYGSTASISTGGTAVAPKYNSAGYLPTDVVGARSKAVNAGAPATGVPVAPAYSDSGHLPTDR